MPFTFSRQVTLGNLLTILAYVLAAVFFIVRLDGELREIRYILRTHAAAYNVLGDALKTHAQDSSARPTTLYIPHLPEGATAEENRR